MSERKVKVKIDHVEKIYDGRQGKMIALNGVDLPYPRTQDLKMTKEFLDLKAEIWGEVYQEYLSVRK